MAVLWLPWLLLLLMSHGCPASPLAPQWLSYNSPVAVLLLSFSSLLALLAVMWLLNGCHTARFLVACQTAPLPVVPFVVLWLSCGSWMAVV